MTDYRRRAMNRIDRVAFSESIVLVETDTRPKRGRRGAEGEGMWWVTYADGRRIGGVLSRKLPPHMRVDGWTPTNERCYACEVAPVGMHTHHEETV